MSDETAQAVDSATAEEITPTPFDPTVDHHLERLQAAAAETNVEQRFVIAAGMLAEGEGSRVLVVQPDGSHAVVFEAAA